MSLCFHFFTVAASALFYHIKEQEGFQSSRAPKTGELLDFKAKSR